MKRTTIITAISISLFAISCGGNEKKEATHEMDNTEVAQALNVKVDNQLDPICGMKMGEGAVFDTINHDQHVYGFCSSHCKESFAKAPADYMDKMGN